MKWAAVAVTAAGAFYLASLEVEGWGWFLVVAVLIAGS